MFHWTACWHFSMNVCEWSFPCAHRRHRKCNTQHILLFVQPKHHFIYLHITLYSCTLTALLFLWIHTLPLLSVLRYFAQNIHTYSMDVLTLCLPLECATTVAEHQEDYTLYEDNQRLRQHCSLCLPFSLIPKSRRKVGCITFPERKRQGGGVKR